MAELSKAIARLMEERERTQPQTVSADVPKLRQVIEAVRAKVTAGERPLAEAFARQLFDKDGAEFLEEREVSELAAIAVVAFRFVVERSQGEPRVRVFDPDMTREGWAAPCSVVESILRDRPFIVDTIQETLRRSGCVLQRLLHPTFAVERDGRGAALAVGPAGALGHKESFVHVEVERVADPEALSALLQQRLTEVVLATEDYQAMRAKAEELATQLHTRPLRPPWNADVDEIAAFLRWLGEKNFVFLGYREYQFAGRGAERTAEVRHGSGLGISRNEDRSSFAAPRSLPEALRRRLNELPLLLVSKTNAESPVHRAEHMDYIGIKEIDENGLVVGERRFLGLLTSKAYTEESAAVPLLRRKLAAILDAEGAIEDSYDYKSIVTVFDSIPKADLLAASVPELRAEIKTILAAEGGSEVKVLQRPDALGRGIFITIILPRERFSNDLYRRVEARLAQAFSAIVLDQRLVMDERDQVRLHFYLATAPENVRAVAAEDLQAQITSLLRTWNDRLRDALREQFPRDQVRTLADRYTAAFSNAYKAATDVTVAIRDLQCIEALLSTRAPQVDLINDSAAGEERFSALKLYLAETELVLSDFLPVLENLGLKVFAEDAVGVALPELGRMRIHTFFVQDTAGARLDIAPAAPLLQPALLTLLAGSVENDRLNGLILEADLDWRQVDLLRAYVNHGVQIGTAPTRSTLMHALLGAPRSARLLWEYFEAKFDPLRPPTPRERLAQVLPEIEQRLIASLDAVQSVSDDRMLRALFSAVAATVRTNFFRLESTAPRTDRARPDAARAADGGPRAAIAVKLECARIPQLPRPHPEYEIYVHAPNVEGLHLRGAKVARGGIRLSDRPDDFRTEILGLMQTQMVKNAVIIPAGAKGGFIPKRRPGTPLNSGQTVAAYRSFISALLDVTDNLVQGRLVPPAATLLYDDPDPYLVVAEDKGTATFSDIANEIAARHQFWLGDAFASGGAHGYDHKKEGITARGAWECVRRHFREMGRNADREVITVVGIGDMSGDVFGNALLLSRRVCLRAAFNHVHIFLDPSPDPARAFAERERLFALPRSSWSDYTASLISEGGGVFSRAAKKVPLSAPVRTMLALDSEYATGEEVVCAILRMDADLLWNGGIGTYVKASDETHVGDSANDYVRINASELRVRVVAEGGNLGFTQRARIEYALRGGRINTDAIDNSAGVDMSDHEVNLKIALAGPVEKGHLTFAERNRLLTELTPEVTRRVLSHNRLQARILSLDQLQSQTRLNDFRELITQLENEGGLDRQLEGLPDRDTLRNRRSVLLGLTRPELAVLLAHSKLWLQHHVLASALPDDPFFESYLRAYFPEVIDTRFGQAVRSHRLRREIIAVEAANALIDTMGAASVNRVVHDTGTDPASVVRAWALVVAASGAADLWAEIGNADPALPVAAEVRCWSTLQGAVERASKWIIETQPSTLPAAQLANALGTSTKELLSILPRILPPAARAGLAEAADALASEGTPRALAERIPPLERLAELFEVDHIAGELGAARATAAEAYYQVDDLVDLAWVRQSLTELPAEDRWERRAVEGLIEGLVYARRQLTHAILLRCQEGGGGVEDCLHAYVQEHQEQLQKLRTLVSDIKSARRTTLAALLVVMRAIGRLADREDT
ncbi:MAG TPA: NAD-glutamate dehydrogenase domain-containing protein [Candidatus Binatia bacterium]